MLINVKYAGGFKPELDREIEQIVGSKSVSSGFWIPTSERDLQFDVSPESMKGIIKCLRALDVKAERQKVLSWH